MSLTKLFKFALAAAALLALAACWGCIFFAIKLVSDFFSVAEENALIAITRALYKTIGFNAAFFVATAVTVSGLCIFYCIPLFIILVGGARVSVIIIESLKEFCGFGRSNSNNSGPSFESAGSSVQQALNLPVDGAVLIFREIVPAATAVAATVAAPMAEIVADIAIPIAEIANQCIPTCLRYDR